MKNSKIILVALTSMLLAGCSNPAQSSSSNQSSDNTHSDVVYDNFDKVLCPLGAPALAWYDQANNENFVTSQPSIIPGEFGQTNYGMIVFDFYNGLNAIKKSHSKFRLARIITGGNLYLVSRSGKQELPSAEDKVVAFGPGGKTGLPVLALKSLYPNINMDNIKTLPDAAAVQAALISGRLEGDETNYDYFLIPQPALQGALGKVNTIKIVGKLREELDAQTNHEQKYIPQAGLFVHQDMYNANKAYFEEQFDLIDSRIDTVLTSPQKAKAAIEKDKPEEKDQKARFGFPAKMAVAVTNSQLTPNGFGFVKSTDYETIDIQAFLEKAGKTGPENDFGDYHLAK